MFCETKMHQNTTIRGDDNIKLGAANQHLFQTMPQKIPSKVREISRKNPMPVETSNVIIISHFDGHVVTSVLLPRYTFWLCHLLHICENPCILAYFCDVGKIGRCNRIHIQDASLIENICASQVYLAKGSGSAPVSSKGSPYRWLAFLKGSSSKSRVPFAAWVWNIYHLIHYHTYYRQRLVRHFA